jgi:hypothetical protein
MHQRVMQPAFRMIPGVECEKQVASRFVGRMANVDALKVMLFLVIILAVWLVSSGGSR